MHSNNGYTLAKAKQLLLALPDYDFAFMEEMFPETVEQCLEFKDFIKSGKWRTLVADGESGREAEFYEPYTEAQAIDICQPDMRQFGIDGIMTIADSASRKNILIAPHNWGSLIGYYMQLHIGRVIGNFCRAEHDPISLGSCKAGKPNPLFPGHAVLHSSGFHERSMTVSGMHL